MSVILVVEQDAGYANRIAIALRTNGHVVNVAPSQDAANQSASLQAPQLVIASGSMPGAAELLDRYSQRRGGPGSIVLLPVTLASQVQAADFRADEVLAKPYSDTDLLSITQRLLGGSGPGRPAPRGGQLTSADIFGDVLAEVEAEAQRTQIPSQTKKTPSLTSSDIDRKLEETLSGVLATGDRLVRPTAPRPPVPAPSASAYAPAPAGAAPFARPPQQPLAPQAQAQAPAPTSAASPVQAPASRPAPPQLPASFAGPAPAASMPPAAGGPATAPRTTMADLSALGLPFPEIAAPRRRSEAQSNEIDDLLDKTLSSLELPSRAARRQAATDPAAVPAAPPRPAPTLPAPTLPAPTLPAPTLPAPSFQAPPPAVAPPAPSFQAPPPSFPTPSVQPQQRAAATPAPLPTFQAPAYNLPAPAATPPASAAPWAPPPPSGSPLEPSFRDRTPTNPPFAAPAAVTAPPASFEAWSPPPVEAEPFRFDPLPQPTSFDAAAAEPVAQPFAPPASFDWSAPSFESAFGTDTSTLVPPVETAPASVAAVPEADSYSGSWSVSSYEDGLATGAVPAMPLEDDGPSDFVSAFAPPPETGSFVRPLRDTGKISTADFGLAAESDQGLNALDGVLQMRGLQGEHTDSELEGSPFGEYRLLERVALGGMAEVWRARRRGVEGFQKTVAIKKILSHLTGSPDFITMFIDEAKLAAQLSHNNIIQIYDLGKVDDDFYIAMEYVEGRDLRTILATERDQKSLLPLPLALLIVAAVARALDYAHRKRDFSNRALGLVHRDVSPQNVLISYEGEIKLCDFGIVKAVAKASTTQMGALKGKLQYMSPEQAWGRDVDARSDIFSLGSVMFEVLTGTKLFTGDSEIGVLDAVRDCRLRSPRDIVPTIPEEIERIVRKALAKNPEDRYSTAGQMEKDIMAAFDGLRLAPTQRALAEHMQQLFHQVPSHTHKPPVLDISLPPNAGNAPSFVGTRAGSVTGSRQVQAPSSRLPLIAAAVIALLVVLAVLAWLNRDTEEAPAETQPTVIQPGAVAPVGAEGQPTGAPVDQQQLVKELVDQQLSERQKQIEEEYERKRRELEQQLDQVQKSGGGGGGNRPRPPAGGN
jgi:serine/threonine protein kinase/DNA-binding NarL/FixJ family response regulator